MTAQVFVVASASMTALGEQQKLTTAQMLRPTMVDIQVEDHTVPYYAMKGPLLTKSFSLMAKLLTQQIEQLLTTFTLNEQQLANTMLFLGSTSLDVGCIVPDDTRSIWLSKVDKLSQYLADYFKLHSLHFTFNTACTASTNALIYAANFIKAQKIDHAIVIGCEFFNQLSMNGFDSLDLISGTSVKPFARSRDGLILGEGIGAVLLSKDASEQTQFELLGGYSSCDDHSLTITEESGAHIVSVINKALANSNIAKGDIDLIKVHGTASIKSDLAEKNALERLFFNIPPAIALKSLVGHTLGACGVIELALLEHCTKNNIMAKFAYQEDQEEELELSFVNSVEAFMSSSIILCNHFGFGGNNAVLLVKKVRSNL